MALRSCLCLSINSESQIVRNDRTQETLPCILDGRFFIYSQTESTNTKRIAICTSCLPKEVKISGFNNSTSNFVTHLKRKHGKDTLEEYQKHLKSVKRSRKSLRIPKCRCQTETRDRGDESAQQTFSQQNFNENIMKFFIHSMTSLEAIDDPFFRKMFNDFNIIDKRLNIVNRGTLKRLINDFYLKETTSIKSALEDVKQVSTTADIWLARTRSFLGITAHWLDASLKRKSKTIACRKLLVKHSYGQIALLLQAVHSEFGLDTQKVLATVTFTNCNFVKAFKKFGLDVEICANVTSYINNNEEFEDSSIVKERTHYEVSNSMLHFNTLTEDDPTPIVSILSELPAHLRCCAYELNLCAITSANKVLKNNETTVAYKHNQVIKKCNKLWSLAGHPESAEIIYNIIGYTLSKPGINRWNSLYDALKKIASIQDKSEQLHATLELTDVLCEDDFQYVNEYVHCSKPIAEALDILQGEQDMYYGILLPCLVSLRKKLQKLNRESFIYWKTLAEKYLESVQEQFAEFFDLSSKVAQNAAVAAISHPRFKDKWLAYVSVEYHSKIKSIFKGAVIEEIHKVPETANATMSCRYKDSYFEFDTDPSGTHGGDIHEFQRSKADAIVFHYLADQDREISMLDRYPEIKNVFKKYNTPLPSAGPVERPFSYATMTNLPTSHIVSDEMFEKRLLLKFNLITDAKGEYNL